MNRAEVPLNQCLQKIRIGGQAIWKVRLFLPAILSNNSPCCVLRLSISHPLRALRSRHSKLPLCVIHFAPIPIPHSLKSRWDRRNGESQRLARNVVQGRFAATATTPAVAARCALWIASTGLKRATG